MSIIINSLVVFALTLILTKSKIMATKREFVELRYEASKVNDQNPGFVHRVWHAIWTCPMCSGFWMAIPVCLIVPSYNIIIDILAVFALNWLIHCLENVLFHSGELFKELSESKLEEGISFFNKISNKVSNTNLPRLVEQYFKKHTRS